MMKNRLVLLSILLFTVLFFSQCKKDYPEDIPEWVKNEITKFKHHNKDCRCHDQHDNGYENPYLKIEEYVYAGETLYVFHEICYMKIGEDILVYDYNGNRWNECDNHPNLVMDTGQDAECLSYIQPNATSTREIWAGYWR